MWVDELGGIRKKEGWMDGPTCCAALIDLGRQRRSRGSASRAYAGLIAKRRKVAERSNDENDSPYVYLKCPRNRKRRCDNLDNYPCNNFLCFVEICTGFGKS